MKTHFPAQESLRRIGHVLLFDLAAHFLIMTRPDAECEREHGHGGEAGYFSNWRKGNLRSFTARNRILVGTGQ